MKRIASLILSIVLSATFVSNVFAASASDNSAPIMIKAIPDQVVYLEDGEATMSLSSYFTDPDGDDLKFAVVSLAPSTVKANMVDSSHVLISPTKVGTAKIRVTADDLHGAKTSFDFIVKIRNKPKIILTTPLDGQKFNNSSNPVSIEGTTYTNPEVNPNNKLTVEIVSPDGVTHDLIELIDYGENPIILGDQSMYDSLWDQDGEYNITATVQDGIMTDSKTIKIFIDRTPPEIPTVTENPQGTATSKVVSLATFDPTDNIRYKIGLKSEGYLSNEYMDYTAPFILNEDALISVQSEDSFGNTSAEKSQNVGGISAPEAPIVRCDVTGSSVIITDTRNYGDGIKVERNFELSATDNSEMLNSGWTDEARHTFSVNALPNAKYTVKVHVRFV